MKHPDAETEIRVPPEYRPLLEDLRLIQKCPDNPNRMGKRAREGLWRSLQKYGWVYPILVDKKGMLGDGEQRLETCLANNEYYAPVLRLDVEDVDRRLLRQITNKLRGVHDPDKDLQEYRRLIEGGRRKELISILQLNEKAIKDALAGKIKEDAYRIPPLEEVVTDIELGDLYQVGNHRILCGDSTQEETYTTLLNSDKADMIFTDPPYGVKYNPDHFNKSQIAILNGDEDIQVYRAFIPLIPKILNEDAAVYTFYSSPDKGIMVGLQKAGLKVKCQLIWKKKVASPSFRQQYRQQHESIYYSHLENQKVRWYGDRSATTILEYFSPRGNKLHPTMKPVALISELIANSSLPGDIVLDPFAGSGSTLIACEQLERQGYMIELDPRYCQIILDRYEAYTGEKPIKK